MVVKSNPNDEDAAVAIEMQNNNLLKEDKCQNSQTDYSITATKQWAFSLLLQYMSLYWGSISASPYYKR